MGGVANPPYAVAAMRAANPTATNASRIRDLTIASPFPRVETDSGDSSLGYRSRQNIGSETALGPLLPGSQPQFKMTPHVRPFAGKDAVHERVANSSVAARGVMADDTIPLRPQRFDGPL